MSASTSVARRAMVINPFMGAGRFILFQTWTAELSLITRIQDMRFRDQPCWLLPSTSRAIRAT